VIATWWPWLALFGLGALHGLNPGMGWLFAVAQGLLQGERRALWRALLPIAGGHALAIAVAVALAVALGVVVPSGVVRWAVIAALLVTGIRQVQRHRHPRVGGMRMSGANLVGWSFLVATAHGAGLMAVPVAASAGAATSPREAHAHESLPIVSDLPHAATSPGVSAVLATLVHSLGYLVVTAALAAIVYDRAGLQLLRRAWVNLDALWAGTLLLTAVVLALW